MRKINLWILAGIILISATSYRVLLKTDHYEVSQAESSIEQQPQEAEAIPTFSQNEVRYGSSGKDVYELQGRLKYLGYYYGKVDSDFGAKTLGSVKWFQSEFGMKADGIVGASTKLKLYNATKDWRPTEPGPGLAYSGGGGQGGGKNTGQGNKTGDNDDSMGSNNSLGLTENEIKLMANAVYGEARGEPFEGQVAVAAVILNRVKAPQFPDTPSGVIFEPRAFTAVADGQIWLEPNEQARKAVLQAIDGWDPTGGCLYYFNPRTATSPWIWTREQVKTIGQHIFCL
ncbi:spore cortex-lytic enzyme [Paenibacillus urinalis]|uniref:Spore cortex-lytic enzyme n=1 Tax=Paenibacillus urinalis TaxID=521520 RepID=A0ABY7XEK8_9BACL|nr:spore cortex-lytic enzyme [Paenibacillus urinalis]WDH96011.1 spore cortex-lytic enzyme [Paenibacillus urinalis]WDI04231.1 spore cortex-lytic enzyme [Paenibacillus urinalis]